MTVSLDSLKKSIGKKNDKSEIFAWLADLEREAGDLDGALQRVNGGLSLYPHDVAAMVVRAKILFQMEKFEECIQQCEEILVKDTFNLAGQKIMGDAFEKMDKIPERNLCYRRFHDMDPLNPFWKEEYDVVDVALASAAVDLTLPDEDLSMPDDSLDLNVKTLAEQEAENAAAMGSEAQEFTEGGIFSDEENASVESSFEKAFGDTFGEAAESDSAQKTEESGIFEKSATSDEISLDDEPQSENASGGIFSSGFEDSSISIDDEPKEDDPFAALAAMLPNNDAAEDSMMDDLSASLDATMAGIAAESSEEKPVEVFPADDNISGTDVNSAMSNFFGLEDDLEAEETAEAGSTFVQTPVDENASANASVVFGNGTEDKPMSVDNAFDSIFGEDELPEELPQTKPAVEEDKPMSVDNAFDSIFGEDELPEELPQTKTAVEEPTQEAALEDVAEDTAPIEAAPEAAELDSLELPEEVSLDEAPEEASAELELPAEDDLSLDSLDDEEGALELPGDESVLELPEEDEVTLDGEWSPTPKGDTEPAAAETLTVEPASDEPTSIADNETSLSVDNAFDSIFGEDELPEELPQEKTANEEPTQEAALEDVAEDTAATETAAPEAAELDSLELPEDVSLDETPEEASAELELPAEDDLSLESLDEPSKIESTAETLTVEPASDELASIADNETSLSVDNAFDSIFGEDELPEELPQEKTANEEPTQEAALEDVAEDTAATETAAPEAAELDSLELPEDVTLEETPEEASPELEQPAEDHLSLESLDGPSKMVKEVEEPVAPEIASAMDFVLDDEPAENGNDENKPSEETLSETVPSDTAFSVDNAFDSLFGDDDDLPEEPKEQSTPAESSVFENVSLADQVNQAESELEMPSAAKEESSDLAQEMGGAFASMFGDQDDDLVLPSATETKDSTSEVFDQQATSAAVEEASANLESDLDKSFSSLFGDDTDSPAEKKDAAEIVADKDSLESEVSGAFKGLFEMDDDSLNLENDIPSNSGVDFLMSGDSDDEVSAGLINNPDAPLDRGEQNLDESLNTRTLAEIYYDQGLFGKALEIYKDLAQKDPEDSEIAERLAEVEKRYKEKFGGDV